MRRGDESTVIRAQATSGRLSARFGHLFKWCHKRGVERAIEPSTQRVRRGKEWSGPTVL